MGGGIHRERLGAKHEDWAVRRLQNGHWSGCVLRNYYCQLSKTCMPPLRGSMQQKSELGAAMAEGSIAGSSAVFDVGEGWGGRIGVGKRRQRFLRGWSAFLSSPRSCHKSFSSPDQHRLSQPTDFLILTQVWQTMRMNNTGEVAAPLTPITQLTTTGLYPQPPINLVISSI